MTLSILQWSFANLLLTLAQGSPPLFLLHIHLCVRFETSGVDIGHFFRRRRGGGQLGARRGVSVRPAAALSVPRPLLWGCCGFPVVGGPPYTTPSGRPCTAPAATFDSRGRDSCSLWGQRQRQPQSRRQQQQQHQYAIFVSSSWSGHLALPQRFGGSGGSFLSRWGRAPPVPCAQPAVRPPLQCCQHPATLVSRPPWWCLGGRGTYPRRGVDHPCRHALSQR